MSKKKFVDLINLLKKENYSFRMFKADSIGYFLPEDADWNYKDVVHANFVHPGQGNVQACALEDVTSSINLLRFPFFGERVRYKGRSQEGGVAGAGTRFSDGIYVGVHRRTKTRRFVVNERREDDRNLNEGVENCDGREYVPYELLPRVRKDKTPSSQKDGEDFRVA